MFPDTMDLANCRPWAGYNSARDLFRAQAADFEWIAPPYHFEPVAGSGWQPIHGGQVVHALTVGGLAKPHIAWRKGDVIATADGRAYRTNNHQLVRWAREYAAEAAAGFPSYRSGR